MTDAQEPLRPRLYNYEENRALAIQMLGGKCAECGSTIDLEIDHIDRSAKTMEVSAFLAKHNPQELMDELKKCQLLCHPCHLKKTLRERGQTPAKGSHGTLSSYRYCRCELCREVHSAYCIKWKKRDKLNRKRRARRRRKNENMQ